MTGPELKALADGLNVNPYYHAYALTSGAASCEEAFKRDRGNHHYMIWNNARWAEQAKTEGIQREFVSIAEGAVDRHIAICAAHIPVASAIEVGSLKICCGNCASWKAPKTSDTDPGECWSGDRLDGDMSKGTAGYTMKSRACEAFIATSAAAVGDRDTPSTGTAST